MGSYDGAEGCELVGIYCNDGLAILNMSGNEAEDIRKQLFAKVNELGLSMRTLSPTSKSGQV